MKIYCITHKPLDYINKLGLIPFGVGLNDYPNGYLEEKKGTNISNKNKYYSETSFHYWYWQNILKSKPKNEWFGMCQYRRYFVKYEYKDLIDNINGQGNYSKISNLDDFKQLIVNGSINQDTIVFNNLIDRRQDLFTKWELPLKESWQKRYL